MITLSVNFTCPVCHTTHAFEVTPARPAPACSNPNSPAFSDSGDPAEVNGPDCCEQCGLEFENYWDAIEQKAYDENPDNDYDPIDSYEEDWPDDDDLDAFVEPAMSPNEGTDFISPAMPAKGSQL